ncbi:MAG: hypothetical protein JW700_01605 [Candidatus Aenigmarchaeota archaeon]|nr:hypothetical protein [Candidatus Aenigmarchaeota archaeon]
MSDYQDMAARLEKIENSFAALSHEFDSVKFKEELFEVLLIISTIKDNEKIKFYLNFFEKLINAMKKKGLWEDVDEELMKDVLTGIADNWKEYKKDDLANIFESWLGKNIIGGD